MQFLNEKRKDEKWKKRRISLFWINDAKAAFIKKKVLLMAVRSSKNLKILQNFIKTRREIPLVKNLHLIKDWDNLLWHTQYLLNTWNKNCLF